MTRPGDRLVGDDDYFGTDASTPSTNQLIDSKSALDSAPCASTFRAPALSLSGPANGASDPSMIACFLASNTRATSAGTDGFSGVSTTTPSLMPQRVWR